MRLICPNCQAEYEVDDAAIPETGRDVQCSNCGHAWFQLPPGVEAEAEAEAAVFDPPPALARPEAVPLPGGEDEDEDDGDDRRIADSQPAGEGEPRPARSLDETVLAVLKEEAEREAAQRRREALRGLETQPDLGLDSAVAGAVAASAAAERAVKAQAKPVEVIPSAEEIRAEVDRAAGVERAASRRKMLPDIEEINSTLRPGRDAAGGEGSAGEAPEGRGGFRRGFTLTVLLAVILAALYVLAPRLAEQVPALAPVLGAYVAAVDSARLWLDGLMREATGAMNGGPPAG